MLEKKGLPGIFVGYVFLCGVWKGDILVADVVSAYTQTQN